MKFLEIFVSFFLFFLPFQFSLSPVSGFDLAVIRVLSLLIFFFWLIQSIKVKKILLPPPSILFFFLAFFLFSFSSVLWAENREWDVRKNIFFLSFAPLFIVFYATLLSSSMKDTIVKWLIYGSFLSAIIALVQFILQFIVGVPTLFDFWVQTILPFFLGQTFGGMVASYPSLLVNISGYTLMRAVGFFPDPHMFSLFLGMTLPLMFIFLQKATRLHKKWWIGVGSTIFIADLLTFSRGGYVGLLAGLGIVFFLFLTHYGVLQKYWLRFLGGGILLFLVLFLSPVGTRFISSFSPTDTSNTERIRLWKESGTFILSHPILGSGLGNYPLVVKPSADYREPIYIHNLYLDIAGELGMTGLFFFLGFAFIPLFFAWRKWHYQKDIYSLAVSLSLCIFFFHSLFETAIFSVHILPLFFFLLALAVL